MQWLRGRPRRRPSNYRCPAPPLALSPSLGPSLPRPGPAPDRRSTASLRRSQIRSDVTRFRYGDEQHLDEALERIFRINKARARASVRLTSGQEQPPAPAPCAAASSALAPDAASRRSAVRDRPGRRDPPQPVPDARPPPGGDDLGELHARARVRLPEPAGRAVEREQPRRRPTRPAPRRRSGSVWSLAAWASASAALRA